MSLKQLISSMFSHEHFASILHLFSNSSSNCNSFTALNLVTVKQVSQCENQCISKRIVHSGGSYISTISFINTWEGSNSFVVPTMVWICSNQSELRLIKFGIKKGLDFPQQSNFKTVWIELIDFFLEMKVNFQSIWKEPTS